MRDLAADLKICEAATHGPWEVEGDWAVDNGELEITDLARSIRYGCVKPHRTRESAVLDAKFIASAREGWPEAIKRAMTAEAEVERLKVQWLCQLQQLSKVEAGVAMLKRLRKLEAQLAEWQQVGDAIMQAVTGKPGPLSDSDVIGEVERLRGELEQERCKVEAFFVGLKDAQECEQAMFVLADKWHSEAELLRQQLAEVEAGAAVMLERLRKLEAVAEAARILIKASRIDYTCGSCLYEFKGLEDAMAALEGDKGDD